MSYIRCLGWTALAVSMFLTEPSVGLAQMPVHVIARDGDPAPGAQSGVIFKGFSSVVINNLGATAFVGGLEGPGITADGDTGLWVGTANSLGLAAREDASASGALGDTRFAQFQFPSLNNLGHVEFFAQLRGSGVNAGNGYGTWAGLPGSVQLASLNFSVGDVVGENLNIDILIEAFGDGSVRQGAVMQDSHFNTAGFSLVFDVIPGDGSVHKHVWLGNIASAQPLEFVDAEAAVLGDGSVRLLLGLNRLPGSQILSEPVMAMSMSADFVPEPATAMLLGMGVFLLQGRRHDRRLTAAAGRRP
jgi:hypothetical protein